jgi:hypothetical protein
LYAKDYALVARRRRCQHSSELHIAVLLKELGAQAPMELVMSRCVVLSAATQGARIEPKYRGAHAKRLALARRGSLAACDCHRRGVPIDLPAFQDGRLAQR